MNVSECAPGEHIPTANPRNSTCARCGRPIPERKPWRDPDYEQMFLANIIETAERRFGIHAAGFDTAVLRRLTMGQEAYGDQFFGLTAVERAENISEEAQDSAAYAVLDTQKRMRDEIEETAAWHLFEIAVLSAAIDAHARALKHEA